MSEPITYKEKDIYITPDGQRFVLEEKQRTTEAGVDYVYKLKPESD